MNLKNLEILAESLKKTKDLGEKQELLLAFPLVAHHLADGTLANLLPVAQELSSRIALFAVVAIEQHEILFQFPQNTFPKEKLKNLLNQLVAIDRFYESMGGIVGYHLFVLKKLSRQKEENLPPKESFSKPEGFNLESLSPEVKKAIWVGIRALDEMGEIYPIGGLGSRLNLLSKTGEPMPAACLPFCGRSLLEGLVRDVQAREFLYHRLFHRQITVPIAMMSSWEKNNTQRVTAICKKQRWFGRPQESFRIFPQISVPVVTEEGQWSMKGALELNVQPGGHGALWKAAEEGGVFYWLQTQDKHRILIRQINNPIAGLDYGLLALVGLGKQENKAFGFASCERLPHAAEGVLVLMQDAQGNKRISNIEYTDFKRFGIEDQRLPTNTNILYADVSQILPILKKNPLPGLILNMKNKEPFLSAKGERREVVGGRLESMMQNISDALVASPKEPLSTFVTYNTRSRTISTVKRSLEVGKNLLETPEGAFYDLLQNAYTLLTQHCGVRVDPFCTQEEYLEKGPSHLFLYHPALGPLYTLIAQKIRGGRLAQGAELQLEIADAILDNVDLEGSLLIQAKQVLGHDSHGIIRYSQCTGKCVLKNVKVVNQGINRAATKEYWKNGIKRSQALTIRLHGHSEFLAEGITFQGGQEIAVPNGERWIAYDKGNGKIGFHVERIGWEWKHREEHGEIIFVPGSISHKPS